MTDQTKRAILSRPKDRSLESYKAWMREFVSKINPNAKSVLTDEQWEDKWKRFWAKVDSK